MIILIDNYDSFTYNLYQLIASIIPDLKIYRNDVISIEEIEALKPEAIFISPGPGKPIDAGIIVPLIKQLAPKIPIFGVCLGHQAIGEAFGGKIVSTGEIVHGKSAQIFHNNESLFKGTSMPLTVGRYHSLMIDKSSFPKELIIEAETSNGIIMAIRHKDYPCYGVQFHPESLMTPEGAIIINNFFKMAKIPC